MTKLLCLAALVAASMTICVAASLSTTAGGRVDLPPYPIPQRLNPYRNNAYRHDSGFDNYKTFSFPTPSPGRVFNIEDYGARSGDLTNRTLALANGIAFYRCVQAANASSFTTGGGGATVLVPAGSVYTFIPHGPIVNIDSITFQFQGTISVWTVGDHGEWPLNPYVHNSLALDVFFFGFATNIHFTGGGLINGNGYPWWVYVSATGIDVRPHLLHIMDSINVTMDNLQWQDSPQYHILYEDVVRSLIEYVRIEVNVTGQKEILRAHGRMEEFGDGLPTFPLNTDGFDMACQDCIVRHSHVENFDDALCSKPLNRGSIMSYCTTELYFYNHTIHWGVGASVGSVPPNTQINCIQNTIYDTVEFTTALKTIYVKPNPCPNPATDGTGIINNILYTNIVSHNPVTWPIWVSTQQQKQPGSGTDTGCSFLYPLPGTTCPTQPCVPVTGLTLRNVTMSGGVISPGLLRCDPLNPCRDFLFENVYIKTDGFPWGTDSYLCQAIENFRFTGNSFPTKCIYHYPFNTSTTTTASSAP